MTQQNNKIWILSIQWATQDSADISLTAYANHEAARKAFEGAVCTCKELDCSEMFNDDWTVAEGYELEEREDYFFVYEEGFAASNFEEIKVYELDVQEEV